MRRTTICGSEHRAALLALVAGLLAGRAPALAAQDTTHARPDTSQRAPDTSQAAPAPTPGLQGQLPATHVVAAGETLWSISQLYFNDPLLWPEIYRLNTSIIDDPHWIYPGEELNLAAGGLAQAPDTTPVAVAPQVVGDTVRAQPAPLPPADAVKGAAPVAVTAPPETTTVVLDTAQSVEAVPPPPPEPSVTYLTVFERRRTAGQQVREVLKAYANRPYRPLRRGEFYAAGFLTEEEDLPYGRVIGNTSLPAIPRFTDRTSALPFDQLAISPAHNASYPGGGSLLSVRIARDIATWGKVGVPTRGASPGSGLDLNIGRPPRGPGMPVRLTRKMPS